jgi:hypothetical protein
METLRRMPCDFPALLKVTACLTASMILSGCQSGFSNEEISRVKTSIKQDFEDKGFVVTEIKLTKESKYSLSGVVRLKKNVPYVGEIEFSEMCDATMDQNSLQYAWKCEDWQ